MASGTIGVTTARTMQFIDITGKVQEAVSAAGISDGVCFLYNPHTTAGLTINEGADPAVQADLIAALKRMVPMDIAYQHQEGNSPAHLMASLMGSSVMVLVEQGRLRLGTWQRIFFCEFDGPRSRKLLWRLQ
ncbi:MAG: secondary thiamine-phosphate synthase enzyme YjbQ [Thermodesulfobacteriota bacterium]